MNILLLFLIISFLALLQSSFFTHFTLFGFVLNFLLLFVLIFVLLENSDKKVFYVAAFSGLWIDIFSTMPIGTYAITLLIFAFLLKKTLKKYVSFPIS